MKTTTMLGFTITEESLHNLPSEIAKEIQRGGERGWIIQRHCNWFVWTIWMPETDQRAQGLLMMLADPRLARKGNQPNG